MVKATYKLFTLILALAVLFSSCFICVDANEAVVSAENEKIMLSSKAFAALNSMNFLGDEFSQKSIDDIVTRAEFVGNISKLAGYVVSDADMAKNPFIDIGPDTKYADEIYNLYCLGIINGTGANIFEPNAEITYAQAFKIVVDVLGYGENAKARYGEFPAGYIKAANQLDLTVDIMEDVYDNPLRAQDAVQLLFNAAMTYIMEPLEISADGAVTYHIKEGETLLTQRHNIFYSEGVMQSNGIVSLIEGKCAYGRAIIGGNNYFSENNFENLIGCKVQYFYKKADGLETILWADEADENNSIILTKEELIEDDPAYSLSNIMYWDGVNKRSLKVDEYADIIYNNSVGYGDIDFNSGTIKFIDNDYDHIYEVVVIEEFKNIFVTAISEQGNFIADKYGDTLFLDDYENINIFKDGEKIELDEVGTNNVLSYISTADKKNLWIYVNGKGKIDTLKAISDKNGKKIYSFNNGDYSLAYSYKKLMDEAIYTTEELELGAKYKLYFDKDGNIAEIQRMDMESLQYALLIDAVTDSDTFAYQGSILMKLLLKSGEEAIVKTEEQIILNGEEGKNGIDFLNDSRVTKDGAIVQQVIQVTFNRDGNVTEIKIANECDSEYGYDEEEFTLDYYTGSGGISNQFGYFVDGRYTLTGDTICFKQVLNGKEDVEYKVVSHYDGGGNVYSIYDCDSNLIPSAVYVIADANGAGWENYMLLVDSVEKVLDGHKVYTRVNAYREGRPISYLALREDVVPADLKRGDVIKYGIYDDMLVRVEILCRLSEEPDPFAKDVNTAWGGIFGEVYSIGDNGIVILYNGSLVLTTLRGNGLMSLQIYDAETDTIRPGTVNDILLNPIDTEGNLVSSGKKTMMFLFRRYTYFRDAVIVYY